MNIDTIYINKVESTNSWLKEYQQPEGVDMTAVWTDFQTAGRGCGSNTWESESGKNLTFSVLFHPSTVPAKEQFILSMANALALKDVLSRHADGITIKWPNDIYWKDKKLCGTLIETTLSGSHLKDCIIGTGINVNQTKFLGNAPNPVSLAQITGQEINREELLHATIDILAIYINKVKAGNWQQIRDEYRASLFHKGEVHPYRYPDGKVCPFLLVDVTDDGHLLLQSDDGIVYPFAFKEIQFTNS